MKAIKFSKSQIVSILQSQSSDKTVEVICREYGIAPPTFYIWKYGEPRIEAGAGIRIGNFSPKKVVSR